MESVCDELVLMSMADNYGGKNETLPQLSLSLETEGCTNGNINIGMA